MIGAARMVGAAWCRSIDLPTAALSVRALVALAAIAISLFLLPACAAKQESADEAKAVAYTVRGRIVQLPRADSPASELQVRHEEIPSFLHTWPDGPLGMKAMVMPFPLGEGVSLDGLNVGDAIEITFEVRYSLPGGAVAGYHATRIQTLPPDTRLEVDAPTSAPQ